MKRKWNCKINISAPKGYKKKPWNTKVDDVIKDFH